VDIAFAGCEGAWWRRGDPVTETYPELKRQPSRMFDSADALTGAIGQELGASEWHAVDQDRIDLFARATSDFQWIHVDPERAKSGPFGHTIAHGYLTLSLLPLLMAEVVDFDNVTMTINYGVDRVRFPAPVPSGSQVRASVVLATASVVDGGVQATFGVTVESDASPKPVCVADVVMRAAFAAP
jgi:acyl dehydratase